jgi:hypothetical protein
MEWQANDGRLCDAFRRLAVVLLELAAIAESVARRSAPIRCLVLFLLCRAEARARDLAYKTAGGDFAYIPASSSVYPLIRTGEDALLAQKFRALAAVFFALSRQAPQKLRTVRLNDTVRIPANCRTSTGVGLCAGLSFFDTS